VEEEQQVLGGGRPVEEPGNLRQPLLRLHPPALPASCPRRRNSDGFDVGLGGSLRRRAPAGGLGAERCVGARVRPSGVFGWLVSLYQRVEKCERGRLATRWRRPREPRRSPASPAPAA